MRYIAYMILMAGVATTPAVALQMNNPGGILWRIEVFFENIAEAIETDIEQKANLILSHAEERLDEQERMIEEGQEDAARAAEDAFKEKMEKLRRELERIDEDRLSQMNETELHIREIIDRVNSRTQNTTEEIRMRIEIFSNGSWSNVSTIYTTNNTVKHDTFLMNTTDTEEIIREISRRTRIDEERIRELFNNKE